MPAGDVTDPTASSQVPASSGAPGRRGGPTLADMAFPVVVAYGADVPPVPTLARMLLGHELAWLPVVALAVVAGVYLTGVVVLHRRGDRWSPWRTASWLFGVLVVAYALVGGVAAYDDTLFSAHAVQHMLLATVAPVPLALGAPVTLALRTLPRRPRKVLLTVLHSRAAAVLSFPLVGFVVLIVSMYGLYFTSLYEATLRNPVLHDAVHAHFLLAGCLFFWPVIGVDPLPKLAYWTRLLLLFVTFPAHALMALALMSDTTVFARGWYEQLDRPWHVNLLKDQQTGAGLMWAAGELVGAVVFVALFAQWARADEREARRDDRRAVRTAISTGPGEDDGGDELAAYNAWLAQLARTGSSAGRR